MQEVTEATWYSTPPEELKTVCECLCILKGGLSSISSNFPPLSFSLILIFFNVLVDDPLSPSVEWSSVKKTMARYDFKTWFTNLKHNVDYISHANVKKVESIVSCTIYLLLIA
jgi:hypothetical protein